jgi:hypothetical protein
MSRRKNPVTGSPILLILMKRLVPAPNQFLASSYFSTVYVPSSSNKTPDILFSHFNLPSNCSFTNNEIEMCLSMLKTSKSAGPNGLPGMFLYNIRSAFYFPLWLIFRRFLDMGTLPSIFKISSVTLVIKLVIKLM